MTNSTFTVKLLSSNGTFLGYFGDENPIEEKPYLAVNFFERKHAIATAKILKSRQPGVTCEIVEYVPPAQRTEPTVPLKTETDALTQPQSKPAAKASVARPKKLMYEAK